MEKIAEDAFQDELEKIAKKGLFSRIISGAKGAAENVAKSGEKGYASAEEGLMDIIKGFGKGYKKKARKQLAKKIMVGGAVAGTAGVGYGGYKLAKGD